MQPTTLFILTFSSLAVAQPASIPSTIIQFDVVNKAKPYYQFEFPLNTPSIIPRGENTALDKSVNSVKVIKGQSDEKCKFFLAQPGSEVLAENVGSDPVTLGGGKGVAVGSVYCASGN